MIDEGILGKCLRISSSSGGLRISPLTPEYVFPRQPPLIPCAPPPEGKRGRELPNSVVKPTKAQPAGRCSVIPCFVMRPNGCLEHAVLFTVRTMGGPGVSPHDLLRVPRPAKAGAGRGPICDRAGANEPLRPESPCPESNYEPFNSSNINIRYWSWNYRGCWHQTFPPIDTRWWFYVPHIAIPEPRRVGIAIFLRCLADLALGNLRACCPP